MLPLKEKRMSELMAIITEKDAIIYIL